MADKMRLSELVGQIQDTINQDFLGETFWVSTQITNVKKYEGNRRCYLTLEEYEDGKKIAELRGVFWANYYSEIEKFEENTKQSFQTGIEIICKVKVRFHPIYGLNADVMEIDIAHTLGSLELERKKTLERLIKENPNSIRLIDGTYITLNKRLSIPKVISNIALITARNSDGQRDFIQEISTNKHDYSISVDEYLTTIQGNNAHKLILKQLKEIEKSKINYDIVAIVRGGGSQTDFKPFDEFELSNYVANYSIPILTGIGHDRNQSIVDLMARELKTPTKVASYVIEHNFDFENELIELKLNFFELVKEFLKNSKEDLQNAKRIVKLSSPQAILNRGFAIITSNNKIVTDPKNIKENTELGTLLRDQTIYSTVTKKMKNEKGIDI